MPIRHAPDEVNASAARVEELEEQLEEVNNDVKDLLECQNAMSLLLDRLLKNPVVKNHLEEVDKARSGMCSPPTKGMQARVSEAESSEGEEDDQKESDEDSQQESDEDSQHESDEDSQQESHEDQQENDEDKNDEEGQADEEHEQSEASCFAKNDN